MTEEAAPQPGRSLSALDQLAAAAAGSQAADMPSDAAADDAAPPMDTQSVTQPPLVPTASIPQNPSELGSNALEQSREAPITREQAEDEPNTLQQAQEALNVAQESQPASSKPQQAPPMTASAWFPVPPGAFPASAFPTDAFLGGAMPAGMYPANGFPDAAMPAGTFPANAFRINGFPSGAMPTGATPAGVFRGEPPMSAFSAAQMNQFSADASMNRYSAVNIPGGVPNGALPGAFPAGAYPGGGFPTSAFPAGAFPASPLPAGAFPAGPFSAGISPGSAMQAGAFPSVFPMNPFLTNALLSGYPTGASLMNTVPYKAPTVEASHIEALSANSSAAEAPSSPADVSPNKEPQTGSMPSNIPMLLSPYMNPYMNPYVPYMHPGFMQSVAQVEAARKAALSQALPRAPQSPTVQAAPQADPSAESEMALSNEHRIAETIPARRAVATREALEAERKASEAAKRAVEVAKQQALKAAADPRAASKTQPRSARRAAAPQKMSKAAQSRARPVQSQVGSKVQRQGAVMAAHTEAALTAEPPQMSVPPQGRIAQPAWAGSLSMGALAGLSDSDKMRLAIASRHRTKAQAASKIAGPSKPPAPSGAQAGHMSLPSMQAPRISQPQYGVSKDSGRRAGRHQPSHGAEAAATLALVPRAGISPGAVMEPRLSSTTKHFVSMEDAIMMSKQPRFQVVRKSQPAHLTKEDIEKYFQAREPHAEKAPPSKTASVGARAPSKAVSRKTAAPPPRKKRMSRAAREELLTTKWVPVVYELRLSAKSENKVPHFFKFPSPYDDIRLKMPTIPYMLLDPHVFQTFLQSWELTREYVASLRRFLEIGSIKNPYIFSASTGVTPDWADKTPASQIKYSEPSLIDSDGPLFKLKKRSFQCPFSDCAVFDGKFRNEGLFSQHLMQAHPVAVSCPMCEIGVSRGDALKRHIMRAHPENSVGVAMRDAKEELEKLASEGFLAARRGYLPRIVQVLHKDLPYKVKRVPEKRVDQPPKRTTDLQRFKKVEETINAKIAVASYLGGKRDYFFDTITSDCMCD